MRSGWRRGALVVAFAVCCVCGTVSAQQRQLPPDQPSIMNEGDAAAPAAQPAKPARRTQNKTSPPAFEQDPELDAADQLAPSQVKQPMPAAAPMPGRGGRAPGGAAGAAAATAPATDAMPEAATPKPPRTAAPRVVTCSGVFGKDSNHQKLATAFEARNIAATEVDTAAGSKVMASVLFGKDPKRRLEVWWSDQANRSDTHLIVINGQSHWTAPGGLRLGLTLAQLEKLNHRPFKLLGFDKDKVAALSDWAGGQLGSIPGGCKVGVNLRADPKTSAAALSAVSVDHEYSSADTAMRAANPTVSEILIGY